MATCDTILFLSEPESRSDVNVLADTVESLGGKGLIAAVTAANEGGDVSLYSLVGVQSQIIERLPNGIPRSTLISCLTRDHHVWVTLEDGETAANYVILGTIRPELVSRVLSSVEDFVDSSDLLYVAVENASVMLAGVRRAQDAGIPIVLNLNRALLTVIDEHNNAQLHELVRGATALLMSQKDSAAALTALEIESWAALRPPRPREIIITNGYRAGDFSEEPFTAWSAYGSADPALNVSAVGVNDSFKGAYLVARFARQLPVLEACTYATGVAAVCAGQPTSYTTVAASTRIGDSRTRLRVAEKRIVPEEGSR